MGSEKLYLLGSHNIHAWYPHPTFQQFCAVLKRGLNHSGGPDLPIPSRGDVTDGRDGYFLVAIYNTQLLQTLWFDGSHSFVVNVNVKC